MSWRTAGIAALSLLALGWGYSFLRSRTIRGEPWERWPEPPAAGFSASGLEETEAYVRSLGTTGLMVVVGGKVLLEQRDVEARGYMAGGRYAIAAMVFGNHVADGSIDLDLTLGEMRIDDRNGLLPVEKEATIRDLLANRSGVYHPTNFGADPVDIPPRGSVEPGTAFLFHPWGGIALKTVFELLTDRDLFQAIGEDLAAPLGLQDFKWWRQNPGHERNRSEYPIWNLYVSTRDLARFGQLMLQRGEWKGEQLIPGEWVDAMTSLVTPAMETDTEERRSRGLGFGYQWWVWDETDPASPYAGAYTYTGSYGQYLTVLPAMDMVVAHQVFAGWYGPPERSVDSVEYKVILDRLIAARGTP